MFRYGISSLLLLGALLISIFYLKPAWDQFRQIRAETDHVRELSAEFDDLIQDRDALIAKLNLVSKDDLKKLEALIPQGPQSLEYLIALQQLAQDNGVGLAFTKADITPPAGVASTATAQQSRALNPAETSKPKKTVRDLPVGIQISGSYEILKTFLGHLEHFGRLTEIPNLTFSASSGSGSQTQGGAFTFAVSLTTYYQ